MQSHSTLEQLENQPHQPQAGVEEALLRSRAMMVGHGITPEVQAKAKMAVSGIMGFTKPKDMSVGDEIVIEREMDGMAQEQAKKVVGPHTEAVVKGGQAGINFGNAVGSWVEAVAGHNTEETTKSHVEMAGKLTPSKTPEQGGFVDALFGKDAAQQSQQGFARA